MPNEVEMNGFLYSILKQQDLKNVDWELVAKDRMITNGHAARMRFSRFKSAQEGREAKPRKPRVPKDTTPRGAKARAAVKKTKIEKDKKKDKKEPFTPPATPIKPDHDDEMALDNVPLSGMQRQLPLPNEPASYNIKPDPEAGQEVVQQIKFIKAEQDDHSETSLESTDFGHTVDMLGHVNIDNFSRAHFLHQIPSTPTAVMTPQMLTSHTMMTPETSPRQTLPSEILAPISIMGGDDRRLFHRHYSGLPVLESGSVENSEFEKAFGGFEEYMNGCRSARDEVMDEDGEPVVKEEQWDY